MATIAAVPLGSEVEPCCCPFCGLPNGTALDVIISVSACPCFTVGFVDYKYTFTGVSGAFTVPWVSGGLWVLNGIGTVTLKQYDSTDGGCEGEITNEWSEPAGVSIGCVEMTGKFNASIAVPFITPGFAGVILEATGISFESFGANTTVCADNSGTFAGSGGGISIA